ncbi:hypothetical protein SAMN04488054_10254 [Salibacterium qingdaonense]|uniref:Uncharacterized protein n=1 Tax=Salibacterium qingdaonense TaxID=266892 RepID=A0A1I4IHM9_9BACI|nr:hypothetical protein SAMN04488054_10254 [Salibacterium qingdaonense]
MTATLLLRQLFEMERNETVAVKVGGKMKSLYTGAFIFCVVLLLTFSILRYAVNTGEGMAVIGALLIAVLSEWWYRKRCS